MPRSDALCLPRAQPAQAARAGHAWLGPAGEVAQWTAQLLAWLWLGQQGAHLGWPWASGVLAVAVWWSLRVLCRGAAWAFRSPSAVVGCFGFLTALGAWLTAQLGAGVGAHASLLALAAVWGVWSALIETRSQVSTFLFGRLPWQPLLAVGVLGFAWVFFGAASPVPAQGVTASCISLLLALCAAVLYVRDLQPALRARACTRFVGAMHHLLAPSAMGLMMGTLWLSHDWCLGANWTWGQVVAAHVALMAGLPVLVAVVLMSARRRRHGASFSPLAQECSGLSLIALGALMGLGSSQAHGVLAMLLPSLAWALHCNRVRASLPTARHPSLWPQRWMALVWGPGLLVLVGLASPVQGPMAMQFALLGLGILAAFSVLALARLAVLQPLSAAALPLPATGVTTRPRPIG